MSKWPLSANRTWEIVSGSPSCFACNQPAVRLVSVQWGQAQREEHPVCELHLQAYRTDFARLVPYLKALRRKDGGIDPAEICR